MMDIRGSLFYIFAFVSTLYVVHFGLYLISANLYDIGQYRRLHRRGRKTSSGSLTTTELAYDDPARSTAGKQPPIERGLVTIGVPAHNEAKVIVRCLESLRRSTYPHVQVLVADDSSSDGTRQLVCDYKQRHPDMNLRVIRMRKNVGKGAALSTVFRRYGRGEFVMSMDADSILRPDAVANAVSYFDAPDIAGVAANVQIIDDPTVLGILQKFEHMVGYRSKKLYSILNCEFVVGGVASTYRMDVLRQVGFYDTDTLTEDIGLSAKITSLGNRRHRLVYGSDVVAMTEGVMTFKALLKQRYRWKYGSLQILLKYRWLMFNPRRRYTRSLTLYRLPMAFLSELTLLVSPMAATYALYITLTQYTLQLILGAYITITAYTLITIWFDENLDFRSRLRLTLYAPIAYFIFYIMDLVQLAAVMRCLAKSYSLIRGKNIGSTWVSPNRIGKGLEAIREA